MISAVFFDFGGVILSSPFEAFERYEKRLGFDVGTIRRINSADPDRNAWARLERGESDVETFIEEFESEAAAFGVELDGREVIECLRGEVRPEMVRALQICSEHLATALLTNNFISGNPEWASGGLFAELLDYFDVVVESSQVGFRKPELAFYQEALDRVGVHPSDVVFLDDLGINLKPAREMGMTTIKVTDPIAAISQLQVVTGLDLLSGSPSSSEQAARAPRPE